MKKYLTTVSWMMSQSIEVEANSDGEAREKALRWFDATPANELKGQYDGNEEVTEIEEIEDDE